MCLGPNGAARLLAAIVAALTVVAGSGCSDSFTEPLTVDSRQFVDDPIFNADVPGAEAEPTVVSHGDRRFAVSRTWTGVSFEAFTDTVATLHGEGASVNRISCSAGNHAVLRGAWKSGDFVASLTLSFRQDARTFIIRLSFRNNPLVSPDAEPREPEELEINADCPEPLLTAIERDADGFLLP